MPEKIPTLRELSAAYKARAVSPIAYNDRLYHVDWSSIYQLFPRYCHVLLVAPNLGAGDYTYYSVQGAQDFFNFANPIATVKFLKDAQATRANVETEIKNFNPRLVVHYDHGSQYAVYGETAANAIQAVLDTANVTKLRARVMSTVSCLSASGLGPTAISNGCSAYVGYNDLHWIVTTTHMAFWACASMVHKKLVLGHSVLEGFNAAITAYNSNIAYFNSIGDTMTAVHLQIDKDRLRLLGNKAATTCPHRIEFVKPIYEAVRLRDIPELVLPLEQEMEMRKF